MGDEPGHIFLGIAQKQPNFVGEGLPGTQPAGQFSQAGGLVQAVIACLTEQAAGLLPGQISGEGCRAKEIEEDAPGLLPQGEQPKAAGDQDAVE